MRFDKNNLHVPASKQVASAHQDKIQLAARLGWGTKGALYVTLGILAMMAAFGEGGQVSGSKGILQWVQDQPFGSFLLIVAALGFACYALWRAIQVITDPERHDSGKSMVAKRIGWALSGLAHASLSVAAFQAVTGGSTGGNSKRMWISAMMQESWGPTVVGIFGVFVVGVGLHQFKKAAKLAFMDDVNTAKMSTGERKMLRLSGRVGLVARGVVFPIIGYYLVKAALSSDAGQVKGVGGALHEIASAGTFMLALVAFGLAAYGVLQIMFARYRRVAVS